MVSAKIFQYRSYTSTFKSVTDVIKHMTALHSELEKTDLSNLQYFNQTYLIITKNVQEKNRKHFFAFEKTMEELDIQFAKYYFDALKGYTDKKKTTPAWHVTFDFCKQGNSLPLIYLAQGVNAHVNNDLGLALYDMVNKSNFKIDYDKVNGVIRECIPDVRTLIHEGRYYQPVMNILIQYWRANA